MPVGQVLRAIGALVFQQVSDVVVAEGAEQAATARSMPGHLEVDESRLSGAGNQHFGLLGEVVVHDIAGMQQAQTPQCAPEIGRVPGLCVMHRRALEVLAYQSAAVRAEQVGYAVEPVQCGQRPCLAPHQCPCEPA